MHDPVSLDAFFLALEEAPGDRATLLALADWHDEQDNADAAACLRWSVTRERVPFQYRRGGIAVSSTNFHDGWYWWAVEDLDEGQDWGHSRHCRLPRPLWRWLRHTFTFDPSVIKEYATVRAAYEALIEAWPRAQPLERPARRQERRR